MLAVVGYLPPVLVGLWALCTLAWGRRARCGAASVLSLATLLLSASIASWEVNLPSAGQFRVVTSNVGTWSADVDRAAEVLNGLQPDVLLLQEVWSFEHAQAVARHFPGWAWARPEEGMDLLILSRFPLRDVRKIEGESLELLTARAELPGFVLQLSNVHLRNAFNSGELPSLASAWRLHKSQVQKLQEHLRRLERPAVLAGDFNAPDRSPQLHPVPAGFVDAFDAAGLGWGNTFPAWLPLWRIDYVLYSNGLKATAARTLNVDACDHRAVVVDFKSELEVPGLARETRVLRD